VVKNFVIFVNSPNVLFVDAETRNVAEDLLMSGCGG